MMYTIEQCEEIIKDYYTKKLKDEGHHVFSIDVLWNPNEQFFHIMVVIEDGQMLNYEAFMDQFINYENYIKNKNYYEN